MTETPPEDAHAAESETATEAESTAVESTGVDSTGNARIDEALTRLDALDDLDINEHPEQFDAIHQALRESLASGGRDGDAPDLP